MNYSNRPIHAASYVPLDGDAFISDPNMFDRMSTLFTELSSSHGGLIGALHFRFSEPHVNMMKLNTDDYTACAQVKSYDWKRSTSAKGIYFNANYNEPENDTKMSIEDILRQETTGHQVLTENNTVQDLEEIIKKSERQHLYGYNGTPNHTARFKVAGALNMYAMDEYLVSLPNFNELRGIATPYALVGPGTTITGIHLEDYKFMSINQILEGQKVWVVGKRGIKNVRRFVTAAAGSVVATGILGCPEQGRDPCSCFHMRKSFFFTPQWLDEHGIEYTIHIQNPGDIMITSTDAFHEIINTSPNVCVARNLCTDSCFASFYNDYVKCRHPLHRGLKLKDVNLQSFTSWVATLKANTVAVRSAIFRVSNINHVPKRKQTRVNWTEQAQKTFQELLDLPTPTDSEQFLLKVLKFGAERSHDKSKTVYAVLNNPKDLASPHIVEALKSTFQPRKNSLIQVAPVVSPAMRKCLGNQLNLDAEGYADIPYVTAQLATTGIRQLEGLFYVGNHERHGQVQMPNAANVPIKPAARFEKVKEFPTCTLCGKRATESHLKGHDHVQMLTLLQRIRDRHSPSFKAEYKRTLECRLCKGYFLENRGARRDHRKSKDHKRAKILKKKWIDDGTVENYGLT